MSHLELLALDKYTDTHTHTRCAEDTKSEGRQTHTWTPFVRTFFSLLPKVKPLVMSSMTSA